MNNGGCNLKVFKGGVIWIDNNTDLAYEKQLFQFIFGKLFHYAKTTDEAIQIANKEKEQNFIIVTNSKLIEKVRKEFVGVINTYSKYLIFCGSNSTVKQCQQKYKDVIATTQIASASDIIHCEDQKQLTNKKKVNQTNRIIWVYQDQLSNTYGKRLLKRLRWTYSINSDHMNKQQAREQLQNCQGEQFILLSNGEIQLHKFLQDFGATWIKYSFNPDSYPDSGANNKLQQNGDDEEDDHDLKHQNDISYDQFIKYARNQEQLLKQLGVQNQK